MKCFLKRPGHCIFDVAFQNIHAVCAQYTEVASQFDAALGELFGSFFVYLYIPIAPAIASGQEIESMRLIQCNCFFQKLYAFGKSGGVSLKINQTKPLA